MLVTKFAMPFIKGNERAEIIKLFFWSVINNPSPKLDETGQGDWTNIYYAQRFLIKISIRGMVLFLCIGLVY